MSITPDHNKTLLNAFFICFVFFFVFSEHYADVSENYDFLYREIYEGTLKVLDKALHLRPDDLVLDLGGGTGFIAQEFYKRGHLKHPVWCVDPSAEMIKIAKDREGVVTAVSSGEEFFSSRSPDIKFDKVLMSGVIHHFDDPRAVYERVYGALNPKGFCLIVTRLSPTLLPYFEEASAAFNESCAMPTNLSDQLKEAGFESTSQHEEAAELHMTKGKWYEMLRGRFFSPLNRFSDEEIEKGIQDLECGRFKETSWDAPLILYDRLLIVKGTKWRSSLIALSREHILLCDSRNICVSNVNVYPETVKILDKVYSE